MSVYVTRRPKKKLNMLTVLPVFLKFHKFYLCWMVVVVCYADMLHLWELNDYNSIFMAVFIHVTIPPSILVAGFLYVTNPPPSRLTCNKGYNFYIIEA